MTVESEDFNRRVYRAIAAIPPGRVLTYGQVAMLAGKPRGHRAVARALRMCPDAVEIPWFRVLSKAGPMRARIGIPDPEGAARQRALLEAEGVEVDGEGRVGLREFGWLPPDL